MSKIAKTRSRKWERKSEVRPSELVAAAHALFTERGFAATRLEEVAARAGVSKGTVYLYFQSKEALFQAVVRAAVTPNLDRLEEMLEAFDGSTPNLIRTLLLFLENVISTPVIGVAKLILAESNNFPELAQVYADMVVRRGMTLMQRVVQRGVDRGEFRPVQAAEIAPLILAPVVLLGLWKNALQAHTDFQIDRRAVLAAHADTLLRGLARDPLQPKGRKS